MWPIIKGGKVIIISVEEKLDNSVIRKILPKFWNILYANTSTDGLGHELFFFLGRAWSTPVLSLQSI